MTETILATLVAKAYIKDYGSDTIGPAVKYLPKLADSWIEASQRTPEGFMTFVPDWFLKPIKEWLCENWKVDYTGSDILPDDVATAFRLTFL